ncbi:MAG: ATP-binding protein [Chitinophagales bacterium]
MPRPPSIEKSMMESLTKSSVSKPTYEELLCKCKALEEQVERSVLVEQHLTETKHELDEELNRLKIIQQYDDKTMRIQRISDFALTTVGHFALAFKLPKCILFEFDELNHQISTLAQHGMLEVPECLDFDADIVSQKHSFIATPQHPIYLYLSNIQFTEAIVCPTFNHIGDLSGVIVTGKQAVDEPYYSKIDSKVLPSYTVMAHKAGALFQNLKTKHQLKEEIEDRKRIEKKLAERAFDLMRSNSDLEEFAYIASHDLKAPVRTISSFSQLLERKYGNLLDGEAKEYLNFVVNSTSQINQLIDDLLQYSRISRNRGELEQVDFNLLVEIVKGNIVSTIKENNAQIVAKDLPTVDANYLNMIQLVQNLIGNAIKFRKKDETPIIRISVQEDEHNYIFKIADNGIGIDEEYKNKVFAIFQRLHNRDEYEGTGIGLAICKKIVERHKGRIWFTSKLNRGTNFYFTLPK